MSTSIDDKKQKKSNQPKSVNWGGFVMGVFGSLLIVAVWGILGANCVYFSKQGANLNLWFPTDVDKFPYNNNSYQSKFIGNESVFNKLMDKLGMNHKGFPYNSNCFFKESAITSYINGRSIIKKYFNMYNDLGRNGEIILFFTSLPLFVMIFGLCLPNIFGFLTTYWGELTSCNNMGFIWTFVLFFIFGLSIIWPILIGIAQHMQLLITLTILPLLVNSEKIKNIISDNAHVMANIFGLFIVSAAFINLDTTISIIIMLTYIVISLKHMLS